MTARNDDLTFAAKGKTRLIHSFIPTQDAMHSAIVKEVNYFLAPVELIDLLEPLAPASKPSEIGTFVISEDLWLVKIPVTDCVYEARYALIDEETGEYLIRYGEGMVLRGSHTGSQSLHHLRDDCHAFYQQLRG